MDREKVIRGLEICSDCGFCETIKKYDLRCPYRNNDGKGCDRSQLLIDALALLKEQKSDIEKLNGFINGFSKDAIVPVRCKDCKYYDYHNGCMSWHDVNSKNDNWYCADGERKE